MSEVSVKDSPYNASGDGTTDDSAAIQACIDANKGKTIVIPSGTFIHADIALSGSSYANTRIVCHGELKLATRSSAAVTNFGGAFVGMRFVGVDGCELWYRGHGNRTVQPAEEHTYLVGLAGVTNMRIPVFCGREVRGDGLYIGQSSWAVNSTNTVGVDIGFFDIYNSSADGRNAISIISGENINIGSLRSYEVGGSIDGVVMPGGFDIEPDQTYETVKNVAVGSMAIVGRGTSNINIQGQVSLDGATANTTNITINNFSVRCTAPADTNDGNAATTITQRAGFQIYSGARNVQAKGTIVFDNAFGDAVRLAECADVDLDLNIEHVRTAVRAGLDSNLATPTGPVNCHVKVIANDIARWGVDLGVATSCHFYGSVQNPRSSFFGAVSPIHISGANLVDTHFSINAQYDANWTATVRQEAGSSLSDCSICNCSMTGAWASWAIRAGNVAIPRINVTGVTDSTAQPNGGTWVQGAFVRNTGFSVSASAVIAGWARLTTGTGNTTGTDWTVVRMTQ